ncbi:PXA domain-containing protein [Lipomyces oligophaga]|uniref:PXA domain-containing protein n=1 Tax=Lipomyces oligophaga TaxID=45792 RepID=UPI0034CECC11
MQVLDLPMPVLAYGGALMAIIGSIIWTNHTVQVAFQAFILGVFTCSLLSLTAVGYFYKRSSPRTESLRKYRRVRFPSYAFINQAAFAAELQQLAKDVCPKIQVSESEQISECLEEVISYIMRDFITPWYSGHFKDSAFPSQVENTIRFALDQVRERLLKIDIAEFVILKILPIITRHVSEFATAEMSLRGKHLNKQYTESHELDNVLASKYNNGELHSAASLMSPDPKLAEREWIKKLVGSVLQYVLPEREAQSRSVFILVQDVVSCSVILPIISAVEEPDTWNQLIEKYASSILQDRKAVQKLRAALDEHAVVSKSQQPLVRLTTKSDERTYEKLIRGLRRVTLLSDARRFRYDITIQLKRAIKDGKDELYVRRLKNAQRVIESRITDLTNENLTPSRKKMTRLPSSISPGQTPLASDPRENYSVQQLVNSAAGLSYFMEFMDRQHRTVLIQFWIVVNGFKNPLEDDIEDGDTENDTTLASEDFDPADKEDIQQIYESYFSDPLLNIPENLKADVKSFLKDGNSTSKEYQLARRAILRAQKKVYEFIEEEDLPKFRKSDIFLKYITSTGPELEAPGSSMNDNHIGLSDDMIGSTELIDSRTDGDSDPLKNDLFGDSLALTVEPPEDVVEAMQAAVDDIIHSRPTADDASSSLSDTSSNLKALSNFDPDANFDVIDPQAEQSLTESAQSITQESAEGTTSAQSISSRSSLTDRKPDLFGVKQNESESNIFPHESALFEEATKEIFSDDESLSDEDDIDTDRDLVDDSTSVHRADPGDLGLTEAIEYISDDINKLINQDAVLGTLVKKAELTNNVASLRILKKSKASVEREIRRKELQRQQYMVQETDNGLYGRSTVRINSTVSGSERGRPYALYIIEVQRFGFDGSVTAGWIVARRYSEFFQLNQHLRRRFPAVNDVLFPKKGVAVLKSQRSFIEGRKNALEAYLKSLLQIPEVCHSRELRSFLSSQEFQGLLSSDDSAADLSRVATLGDYPPINGDSPAMASRRQSGAFVTKLYNTLSDGMDDIFGNLPGASSVYNAAAAMRQLPRGLMSSSVAGPTASSGASIMSGRDPIADDTSTIMHHRSNSSGEASMMSRPGSTWSESLSAGTQNNAPGSIKSMPVESNYFGSGEHRDISEVESELNSYDDVALGKSGEVPFIKPICDLFLEFFDLNKSNNWLRGRASVVVLQQLLGGTIERKIRDQLDGLAEENTVVVIIKAIRDKVWPGGSRGNPSEKRSAKEQNKTKMEAAFLLNTLVQDMAAKVVGSTNAKHASRRLFAMLQNRLLNLHIICKIVDEVMQELFPEIKPRMTATVNQQ